MKTIMPEDKAATYDLTPNVMLIIMCSIALIIYLNLSHVIFHEKKNELEIKTPRKNFLIKSENVIKVKRTAFLFCEIIYKDGNKRKSILFEPSFRKFFPFTDYPQKIKEILNK